MDIRPLGMDENGKYDCPFNLNTGKRCGVQGLFRERLVREGRWKEFHQTTLALRDSEGTIYSAAASKLMRTVPNGYVDAQTEYRLYWEAKAKEAGDITGAEAVERNRLALEAMRERKRKESEVTEEDRLQNAISALPDEAPSEIERAWIRSHPAMVRQVRQKDKEDIVLSSKDVLDQSNGPAPSKAAVNSLQYWCNNPTDFYRSEIRKKDAPAIPNADAAETPPELDPEVSGDYVDDFANIEMSLASLKHSKKAAD